MSNADRCADPTRDEIEARRTELLADEPLVHVFSRPAVSKILSVLIPAYEAMSVSALARQADVSPNTVRNCRDILLEHNLIEHTGDKGGASYYRAKMDSEEMQAVVDLHGALR
ncbi:helix-turn-helix domain-containing protein [Halorientalis brevis]|uniref:Helix-turn-helix domain-containing protein n=1 Tax=Halorientalis brevis TaxID=1126241 RepID=A0ABD6CE33_9EURY|nr:helix-turn-helix domain-containing protein [Halorientalis brevis]